MILSHLTLTITTQIKMTTEAEVPTDLPVSLTEKTFNSRCTTCGEIVSRGVTYNTKPIHWTCSVCKDPTKISLISSNYPCPHCNGATTVGACEYCPNGTYLQLIDRCDSSNIEEKVVLISMARQNAKDSQGTTRQIYLVTTGGSYKIFQPTVKK